jgi:hypothetical protein
MNIYISERGKKIYFPFSVEMMMMIIFLRGISSISFSTNRYRIRKNERNLIDTTSRLLMIIKNKRKKKEIEKKERKISGFSL